MKVNLIVTANKTLWPTDDIEKEKLSSLKVGEFYICDIKLNQNYRLHSKIFGFFKFCAIHYYGNIDVTRHQIDYVRRKLTVIAGYFDQVFSRDGDTFELVPKSISYEKMPPEERGEYYKKITDAALKRVFDRTTDQNILNQLVSWF